MESRLLLRAAAAAPRSMCQQTLLAAGRPSRPATVATSTFLLALSQRQQTRTKTTANRTKRALNVAPHPSFLLGGGASGDDVVIFNPPSSEASVYHTPFKFLPPTDARRRANVASLFASAAASSATTQYPSSGATAASQLPAVKLGPRKRMVTAAEVAEMRRLRSENPIEHSVQRLAARYGCTKLFVMIATGSKDLTPHKKRMQRTLEKVRNRWGPTKAKARADRYKRTEMLYRGEL